MSSHAGGGASSEVRGVFVALTNYFPRLPGSRSFFLSVRGLAGARKARPAIPPGRGRAAPAPAPAATSGARPAIPPSRTRAAPRRARSFLGPGPRGGEASSPPDESSRSGTTFRSTVHARARAPGRRSLVPSRREQQERDDVEEGGKVGGSNSAPDASIASTSFDRRATPRAAVYRSTSSCRAGSSWGTSETR